MREPRPRHHHSQAAGRQAGADGIGLTPPTAAAGAGNPEPTERGPADPYARVTQCILTALEAGTIPWKKPWATLGGLPLNLVTRRPYRGMNVILLSLGQPYASPWWLTYKQAQALGGHVRKGEHGSLVTFWKLSDAKEPPSDAEEGETRERRTPLIRTYQVFNVEQCEGITAPPTPGHQPQEHERLAACETIVAAMPSPPTLGRDPRQAFYAPALDLVALPDLSQFDTAENYYSTLFHELVHSTGHLSRLGRAFLGTPAPFGSPDYSREELVAEFGAAFLCAQAGILPATVENQASYINGWLAVLKKDKRLLLVAAGQAQRAADFILGASSAEPVPEESGEPVAGAPAFSPPSLSP